MGTNNANSSNNALTFLINVINISILILKDLFYYLKNIM